MPRRRGCCGTVNISINIMVTAHPHRPTGRPGRRCAVAHLLCTRSRQFFASHQRNSDCEIWNRSERRGLPSLDLGSVCYPGAETKELRGMMRSAPRELQGIQIALQLVGSGSAPRDADPRSGRGLRRCSLCLRHHPYMTLSGDPPPSLELCVNVLTFPSSCPFAYARGEARNAGTHTHDVGSTAAKTW